ncbi:ShlB/FhaC/HecB family hemolysin secretion/activation protein, partial [Klebsiella pneumoniae]|uniref:ShlB/FhaC/HecB family hemolysin secretion/activation protein n=1 Tax=Klebsiella pneumoniae TaxID=573 RepID=UPI001EF8B2C0
NNYVEDTRLEDQSTRITETQLGFNHGRRIGSGFVNLDLGWQQGIGALGAQGRGQARLAGDGEIGSGPEAIEQRLLRGRGGFEAGGQGGAGECAGI